MFPYQIKDVDEKTNKELMDDFKGERNGFCLVGPKKWCLPINYREHAEKYYNFKLRNDDIWIITYPRSGTTWTQELIWLLNNNLDFKTASEISLMQRFPFLEFNIIHSRQFIDDIIKLNNYRKEVVEALERRLVPGYVFGETMKSPRHIKSHLPFDLLPPKLLDTCKVVYVARNAKDVAASYYHHNRLFTAHGYVGDFLKYWDYFEKDLLMYSPYSEHIIEAWGKKGHPNLLFLFYEEMIKDLPRTIKKVALFLGKNVNEDQISTLANHLHIDNFRKIKIAESVPMDGMVNPEAEGFIRRGKVGGNKEFTEGINARAEQWVAEKFKNSDIKFDQGK